MWNTVKIVQAALSSTAECNCREFTFMLKLTHCANISAFLPDSHVWLCPTPFYGRKIIRNNVVNRSACLTWFKEEQVLKTWTTLRGQIGPWIKSKSEWTLRLPHLPLLCSGFLSSIRRSRLWCLQLSPTIYLDQQLLPPPASVGKVSFDKRCFTL